MVRTLVVAMLIALNVSGCAAMAEYAAQQEAQRQAQIDALQARIAQLTPEQKDKVQQCSSIAAGKIQSLRMAGQAAATYGMNEFTVASNCVDNPYYFQTIPNPPTQVIVNAPPPGPMTCTTMEMGGGMATTNCN
jgi:tRNA-dihydrouridine synthase